MILVGIGRWDHGDESDKNPWRPIMIGGGLVVTYDLVRAVVTTGPTNDGGMSGFDIVWQGKYSLATSPMAAGTEFERLVREVKFAKAKPDK